MLGGGGGRGLKGYAGGGGGGWGVEVRGGWWVEPGARGGQRWPAEQWLILQTLQSLDLYLLTEQFITSLREMYVFLMFMPYYRCFARMLHAIACYSVVIINMRAQRVCSRAENRAISKRSTTIKRTWTDM